MSNHAFDPKCLNSCPPRLKCRENGCQKTKRNIGDEIIEGLREHGLRLEQKMLLRHGFNLTVGHAKPQKATYVCMECANYVDNHTPGCMMVEILGEAASDEKLIQKYLGTRGPLKP